MVRGCTGSGMSGDGPSRPGLRSGVRCVCVLPEGQRDGLSPELTESGTGGRESGRAGAQARGGAGWTLFPATWATGNARHEGGKEGETGTDRQAETETERPELHRWWPSTRQARSEGRTDQDRQAETGTETDGQTPNCTGGGQAPGRPGLKEGRKRGPGQEDRHTDPGCTGHGQRQAGRVE